MIELRHDALVVSFPEVHPDAVLRVEFQRTLRIPDDDRTYPLPPGLGAFPLRHVDDHAARVPEGWLRRGGVMLPMYQAEAMWLSLSSPKGYPFAVKVATGKVSAVTGEPWREGLHRDPQDYLVVPEQPWLDGYVVERGTIRQFVAMPLGAGYSAEEQLTGRAEHGGLQLLVHPMKAAAWERRRPRFEEHVMYSLAEAPGDAVMAAPSLSAMSLAPGGRMRQEVYDDPYRMDEWELRHSGRCFVHLANSMVWRAITGQDPPTVPPTAEEYTRHGLPWFEYYAEGKAAVPGTGALAGLEGVAARGARKGERPLPENEQVDPANVVHLRKGLRPGQVREGAF
jgi:hypothetical protein